MQTHHTPQFQPRQPLGRTGFIATQLGIGDLADRALSQETCVATAIRALHTGMNVIDTAPGYEAGFSEEIVGQAVRSSGIARDQIFVITKIDHMDQPIAPQVDASLQRLQLDHVDLLVIHGISRLEDWHRVMQSGAACQQMKQEQQRRRTRFVGISSHHPHVLQLAISSGFCDVVMFPIGPFVDVRYVEQVLPLTRQYQVGTVCFKTFGAGKLLADTTGYNQPLTRRPRGKISSGQLAAADATSSAAPGEDDPPRLPRLSVDDCLHYSMTVDPDVVLLGLSFPHEQDQAWASYARFRALNEAQMQEVRTRAALAVKDKGDIWWNPPAE